MKPNYLLIGVQKAGTTSILNILNQHPNIYMHDEIHYFDNKYEKINYELQLKTKKKCIGEKTPSYCYLRFVIDRIKNDYPDIKLIIILREPIQRAFSQYNMEINKKKRISSNKKFIDTIKDIQYYKLKDIQQNGYWALQRGYYYEQISYIYSKFQKKNIYIGIFEDIFENPNIEFNKIFKFLNCKSFDISIVKNHVGDYTIRLSKNEKKYLYDLYKTHNNKLYKLLDRKISKWEKFYDI